MKTRTNRTRLVASLGAILLLALNAGAQTAAATGTAIAQAAATNTALVKLPYGVEDVLKLTRAQVSEDVTLTFIHNSGTIYNLSPNDIVYLRNQGVSDRVINVMLDSRKNVPAEAAAQAGQSPAPAAVPAPPVSDANVSVTGQAAPQYAPAYAQTPPAVAQPDVTYAPASTLYVIPYSSSTYYYPSYSPYWGSYYGYWGPSFVFSYGYRGGGYYNGYYGGYHGGPHGGGPYRYHGHR
jgi:hypothetical protein